MSTEGNRQPRKIRFDAQWLVFVVFASVAAVGIAYVVFSVAIQTARQEEILRQTQLELRIRGTGGH
jgi:hypothetical protein